jgi:hypothetical protein
VSDHLSEMQKYRRLIEAAERPTAALTEAIDPASLEVKASSQADPAAMTGPAAQVAKPAAAARKCPSITAKGSPNQIRKQFNTAFAAARKRGLKQFKFNGKLFTTDVAPPKAKVDAACRAAPGQTAASQTPAPQKAVPAPTPTPQAPQDQGLKSDVQKAVPAPTPTPQPPHDPAPSTTDGNERHKEEQFHKPQKKRGWDSGDFLNV